MARATRPSQREASSTPVALDRRPRLLIIGEDASALENVSLTERGFDVEHATSVEALRSTRPPDLVVACQAFDQGHGCVAVSFLRPMAPSDARRVLSRIAEGQERALADALGITTDQLADRLADLLPGVSGLITTGTLAVAGERQMSKPRRFALATIVDELEDLMIRFMLASATSDREAARWLGLSEATMRSKMRRRGIPSPRARRPKGA